MSRINESHVFYFGQRVKVSCDRRCEKAWGINNRPRVQLSDDEDDFAYFADGELGLAPVDPGTYEGGDAKPACADEFPNRWCVRDCERCAMSAPGEAEAELPVRSFETEVYNQPWKYLRGLLDEAPKGEETVA